MAMARKRRRISLQSARIENRLIYIAGFIVVVMVSAAMVYLYL